jgi:hypothetical protein
MRNIYLLIIAFVSQINYAQNTYPFPSSGNVGIGTTTPKQKLTIVGDQIARDQGGPANGQNSTAILRLQSSPNGAGEVLDFGMNIKSYGWIQPQDFNDPNAFYNLILNAKGGNIGIGTLNPTQKLEVYGSALFQGMVTSSISSDTGGSIALINPSKKSNGIAGTWKIFNMTGGYGNSLQFWAYDNLGCETGLCNNRFTIMDNGNVGIGNMTPSNKLDVNGTVHSKEVKVDMSGWPDFVFKKEYTLPTLEEVEKHIAERGHLENIPSEEEVLKDGISLGEMNSKLLQKIEELTLYIIQQNRKIYSQEDKIKELEKEITAFKSFSERLAKIEQQLK